MKTHAERLEVCKTCVHQKVDESERVTCGWTNQPPDFEDSCFTYEAVGEDGQAVVHYEDASSGSRLANYIIDSFAYVLLNVILGAFIGIFLGLFAPESLGFFEEENFLVEYLFGFVASLIYYTAFEAATGRTIGKYITKTKVIHENGEHPTLRTTLIRSLCRHIPFNAFSFLGGHGWHDSLSKTRVVYVRK